MRMRTRSTVLAAVAGIVLTGLAGAPAQAAPAAAPAPSKGKPVASVTARPFTAEGTVAAVDVAGNKVTVAGEKGTTTVAVAPNTSVAIDRVKAALAKLPVGARVKVSGNTTDGVNVAARVEADTTWLFASAGTVVSATSTTVTVKRPLMRDDVANEVVPVGASAKVLLDGRTVALADLPARATVAITGTVTNGVRSGALVVALSRWQLKLDGTVSAVDAVNGTVTVNTGKPATALKLNVNPNATIKLNGATVSLKDLPIGATVNLTGTDSTVGASVAGITAKLAGKTR